MKTVKYVAYGNCKVKVGGKEYSGTQVIPTGDKGLSEKDIERLLKDKFIRKLELDEGGDGAGQSSSSKPATPEKKLEQMNKAELLTKAKELGIEANESLTVAELRQKIVDKQAGKIPGKTRDELLAEAAALGLVQGITEATTDEEIQKLITEAQP